MLQAGYPYYIGKIFALYLSVEACCVALHGAVIAVELIVDDISGARAVSVDDIQQSTLLAHNDPEVAFLHSLPLGVLLRDKYLEVGLVRSDVVVAEHRLAYGLVEVSQRLRRPAQQEAGCRFLEVEALVFKIMDDPLHWHGIHIAQLKKSGDKGRGVIGVHKYSRWGLWLKHPAVLRETVESVDYFLEVPRYIDVSRTDLIVRRAVSLHLFQWTCLELVEGWIIRINVLVFYLALLMDISLGTVVATGLPADAPSLVKDFLFLICKLRLLHLLLIFLVKELAHALDFVVGLLEVLLLCAFFLLQGFDDGRQFGTLANNSLTRPVRAATWLLAFFSWSSNDAMISSFVIVQRY